jgi:Sulfotransferase family
MTALPELTGELLKLAAAEQRRLPDFFIVGHAKSGTTALYEMLRQHPQIYMPDFKEPQFFAGENLEMPASREHARAQGARRGLTFDEYLSLFDDAKPDQLVGEASTFYLWSQLAPGRIGELQPGARIIAILREPASFLRSVHLQLLQNNAETERDLRKAVALDDDRRQGRHVPRHAFSAQALIYSDKVRYVEQLRRYHAVFDPKQVLVLIYDDFRRDNEGTVRSVLRFLEVDDRHQIEPVEANPTVTVRSKRVNQLRRALASGRGPLVRTVKTTGKAVTSIRVRKAIYYPSLRRGSFREAPPPDEGFMRELRTRFKPEVVALSEYLGRDLVTEWGYDAVG